MTTITIHDVSNEDFKEIQMEQPSLKVEERGDHRWIVAYITPRGVVGKEGCLAPRDAVGEIVWHNGR